MNILRNIFTLKVIAFIVLSSLFMTSVTTTTPALAFHKRTCPCIFFSSLHYIEGLTRRPGETQELCFSSDPQVQTEISQEDAVEGQCTFSLFVNEESTPFKTCRISYECPLGVAEWGFDLDPETTRACIWELRIINWLRGGLPECGG